MADQTFAVNCGFFDSVDKDRLYSADEMNRPYKRVITNGVFATQVGTPSNDLQVMAQGNSMNIIVSPGEGLFGDKWFQNPTALAITVPDNTNIVARIDSVIAQVDKRQIGRVGNIVYRTGSPASTPTPPSINQISSVIEYRIANIRVGAGAVVINQANITDCRGSSECPWITSLIKQVDTSTLFNQYQEAFEFFYDETTSDFESWSAEKKAEFEQWLETLTEQLSVATNVIILDHTYISTGHITTVPIGIPSYDKETDALMVFANGLKMTEGENYTIDANSENIVLKAELLAGQIVNFFVLKSVMAADIQTTATMIQELNDEVADLKEVTDMVMSVSYVGTGTCDNIKLTEMVQDFLSGGNDYKKLEITVHGTFSVTNSYESVSGTSYFFNFANSSSTRRVCVDFADCDRIVIDNTNFTNSVCIKAYDTTIKNMQVVMNNCTDSVMIEGTVTCEDCEFWMNEISAGAGSLVGAYEGTFIRTSITLMAYSGSAYGVSGNGGLLKLDGCTIVAMNAEVSQVESVAVQVQGGESDNVLIMNACSLPLRSITDYQQTDVVKVNDGFYCLTGNMLGKAGTFYSTGDGKTEVGTMIVSK